jgi:prepilin-type N-terminal cleavage/methylation domain-containing protein
MAALPRRLSRGRRPAGYTLVEVVVAMLISAIMVTAMFGVAISQKVGTTSADHRLLADQAMRQVSSQLRGYVTGCGCSAASGTCAAPGCTMIAGPNAANGAGVASWSYNAPSAGIVDNWTSGGACPAAVLGSCPGTGSGNSVWALANGAHVLSGVLPAWFEAAPYCARACYVVNTVQSIGPNSMPVQSAVVSVNWAEP